MHHCDQVAVAPTQAYLRPDQAEFCLVLWLIRAFRMGRLARPPPRAPAAPAAPTPAPAPAPPPRCLLSQGCLNCPVPVAVLAAVAVAAVPVVLGVVVGVVPVGVVVGVVVAPPAPGAPGQEPPRLMLATRHWFSLVHEQDKTHPCCEQAVNGETSSTGRFKGSSIHLGHQCQDSRVLHTLAVDTSQPCQLVVLNCGQGQLQGLWVAQACKAAAQ